MQTNQDLFKKILDAINNFVKNYSVLPSTLCIAVKLWNLHFLSVSLITSPVLRVLSSHNYLSGKLI